METKAALLLARHEIVFRIQNLNEVSILKKSVQNTVAK